MERYQVISEAIVKNKKHNVYEVIDGIGKAKINGEWVEAVFYHGMDRISNDFCYFCRAIDDFLPDFELVFNGSHKLIYLLRSYYTNGEDELNCISEDLEMVGSMKRLIEGWGSSPDDSLKLDHCEVFSLAVEQDVNVISWGEQEICIFAKKKTNKEKDNGKI